MCKAATRDPTQRIVITGMGVASCFGNNVDTFYDRYVACLHRYTPCLQPRSTVRSDAFLTAADVCSLLEGKSGVGLIARFDASEFPTKFAAQIRKFDTEE